MKLLEHITPEPVEATLNTMSGWLSRLNVFDRWHGYTRTKMDVWIDGAALFFCLGGGLFLIIALSTLFPVFLDAFCLRRVVRIYLNT